jgi:hypothetical protein
MDNLEVAVVAAFENKLKEWEQLIEPLKVPARYISLGRIKFNRCETVGGSGLHYHELACQVCTDYTVGSAMSD